MIELTLVKKNQGFCILNWPEPKCCVTCCIVSVKEIGLFEDTREENGQKNKIK